MYTRKYKNFNRRDYADDRLYRFWKTIRNRCNNPNNPSYHLHGGVGIKVCEEWDDFQNFNDWAKANGYDGDKFLIRIDHGKDYCPENCAFSDESKHTIPKSRLIYYNGYWDSVSGWCRRLNISRSAFTQCLIDCDWQFKKALMRYSLLNEIDWDLLPKKRKRTTKVAH